MNDIQHELNFNIRLFSCGKSIPIKVGRSENLDTLMSNCSKASLPISVTNNLQFTDKLLYIYTSGTTGLPKAAVIKNSRSEKLKKNRGTIEAVLGSISTAVECIIWTQCITSRDLVSFILQILLTLSQVVLLFEQYNLIHDGVVTFELSLLLCCQSWGSLSLPCRYYSYNSMSTLQLANQSESESILTVDTYVRCVVSDADDDSLNKYCFIL